MVSDAELTARLQEFLRNSDLNTTTTGIVRRQLEKDFGVDLSDKKVFVREQVDLFLQNQFENAQQNGSNGGEEEVEGDEEEGDNDDQTGPVKSEETDGSDRDDEEEASNGKGAAKKRSSLIQRVVYDCCGSHCYQLAML